MAPSDRRPEPALRAVQHDVRLLSHGRTHESEPRRARRSRRDVRRGPVFDGPALLLYDRAGAVQTDCARPMAGTLAILASSACSRTKYRPTSVVESGRREIGRAHV